MDRKEYSLGEPDFAPTSCIFAYLGHPLQKFQIPNRIEEARAIKAPQQLELFPLAATQESAAQRARDIGRTTALEKCPDCSCTQAEEYPGQGPHYKALHCACCDRFLRWLPKPKQDKGGAL